VRASASRRCPRFGLLPRLNPRLCAGSVMGNLHSTTTPALRPSPVVLPMLFMVNAAGLAIPAAIVVLCRFLGGCGGAGFVPPSPAPFTWPPSKRQQGEGVGEGGRGSPAPVVDLLSRSAAQTRAFVSRLSLESCVTRQHRRHIRALSYYACSSCIGRQASPSEPELSWYAGFGRVPMAPAPSLFQRRFKGPLANQGRPRVDRPPIRASRESTDRQSGQAESRQTANQGKPRVDRPPPTNRLTAPTVPPATTPS
jgi:hypothetical protein